ncbi:MFS transporter [Brevibacillus porteri]|uniref:MFS transporter n=1 Tax=Brevibacillus porteri TaxID=2126350 RepID=A0ABX5FT57_9BACL|nr:MFS transporter [Brevibacillus porteri]MED1797152.1 MFS transporter [Brevibacillus porteri]MED2133358.1 MFS transporter [Brevibacillus porteri]MED2746383.1 MFS transporter [Brevibacillus porteri]MED2815108.1 MFS transporter [Brevibacillus porteri]MED2892705.1 MFS transporter [Brevibacillus porteri]
MSQRQRFFMMIAICLGAFLSHFTAGIVNVSLPQFTSIFQTELAIAQWITTGYLLVIASLLPFMGKLGDRYGHRVLHNYGFLLFTVSSVLVAFSTTITMLLMLRIVQAVGAAMFQATNIALIAMLLPKEMRGRAMGIMSTAVALGGMTGPIAGGMIASWLSWEWLFLIHVPVAILATGLAFRYIPSHKQTKKARSLDLVGAGLFMLLVSSVIMAISNGNGWGWDSQGMLILFGGVLVLAGAFVWWERRQSVPFLPVAVFRLSAVSSGLFISFTSFVLANLVLVVMPFYLHDQAHVSPLTAGYMMTAYPLMLALTGPFSGWASDRYRARPLIFAGLGAGMTVLAIWLEVLSTVEIIALLALVGAGMGLIASPNNSYIMRHVPLEHAGAIGGMIALTRNAGMVVGAALGLGMMNGESNQAVQPMIDAYRAVFEAGGLIWLSGLLVWWYAGSLERQKKRGTEVEKA